MQRLLQSQQRQLGRQKTPGELRRPSTRSLLRALLSQPTAPFRETRVRAEIIRCLDLFQISWLQDSAGNLIAGVGSLTDLKRLDPLTQFALMAHMDHPGFLLDRELDANIALCRWYGGAPWSKMQGAPVRLYDPLSKHSVSGRITRLTIPQIEFDDGLAFEVCFARSIAEFSERSFGGFDFPAVKFSGERVNTRAADDLAGCTIALGALIDQKLKAPRKTPFIAVFTRAEEVGFVGCTHLLRQRLLPRRLAVISLEASRTRPGAEIGSGPVLRVGDRTSLFDSAVSARLWTTAEHLAKATKTQAKPFTYQRQLMSGGTCEATPLALFGHPVSGIAVPLGNYHNCGARGEPRAEIISLRDVDLARRLCVALGDENGLNAQTWRQERLSEVQQYHRELRHLLLK